MTVIIGLVGSVGITSSRSETDWSIVGASVGQNIGVVGKVVAIAVDVQFSGLEKSSGGSDGKEVCDKLDVETRGAAVSIGGCSVLPPPRCSIDLSANGGPGKSMFARGSTILLLYVNCSLTRKMRAYRKQER